MYIGQQQVSTVAKIDDGFSLVTFEDGTNRVFADFVLETIQTEEPIDSYALYAKRTTPIVEKIMEVLLAHAPLLDEITPILQEVSRNVGAKADEVWTKALGEKPHERNLYSLHKFLIKQ